MGASTQPAQCLSLTVGSARALTLTGFRFVPAAKNAAFGDLRQLRSLVWGAGLLCIPGTVSLRVSGEGICIESGYGCSNVLIVHTHPHPDFIFKGEDAGIPPGQSPISCAGFRSKLIDIVRLVFIARSFPTRISMP